MGVLRKPTGRPDAPRERMVSGYEDARENQRDSGVFRREDAAPAPATPSRQDRLTAVLGATGLLAFPLVGAAFTLGRIAPSSYITLSAIATLLVLAASTFDQLAATSARSSTRASGSSSASTS